jgi:LysR family transcriptional activator of nhaA
MINYKHLRYFWMVAKEGSIAKASKLLFLTPQTISGQLSQLEEQLGIKLFTRVGRNLQVTDAGKVVQNYANDIFSLGDELQQILKNKPLGMKLQLKAGIANSIPKAIAYHLLEPALHLDSTMRLICREDNLTILLTELAEHKLDIVISDKPLPDTLSIKCFNHHLGKCGISFFGTKTLAEQARESFPACLDNMPLLLPGDSSSIKNKLLQWFEQNRIRPEIVAEFDDGALMKAFGKNGAGIFVAPSITAKEVMDSYYVERLGETEDVMESFYAISAERKVKHPGVVSILNSAREQLFMEKMLESSGTSSSQ